MKWLALAAACIAAIPVASARAKPIEVAPPGQPNLEEAIVLAEPGDVIVLPPGEFVLTEGEALEEKDLTLRGAGAERTVVIPSGGGEALEDPGVTKGLTVAAPRKPDDAAGEDDGADGGISGKAQVIALIATVGIFLFILELVRRRRLAERYAILWMGAGFALLVLSIWTGGLDVIADAMGIEEPANAIFLLAFALGFLLLLNFSVASSRLSEETKILAQEAARLDQELRAQQAQNEAPVAAEDRGEQT
ncbi:MAG: DUF2304 domain-containing protein [Actinomycetota bacterium]|nr:DUF2304 domain-containing protein [Actinomycetota bacterium]